MRHQDILSPPYFDISEVKKGLFARMFPQLFACIDHVDSLGDLMILASLMQGSNDHSSMPAGYTYLGQFIAHDMSFDLVSLTERRFSPEALSNFRTPAMDLDSVYGGGPMVQPYIYEEIDGNFIFRLDKNKVAIRAPERDKEKRGPAIIPDPRNDENVVITALHSAIMCLHNELALGLRQNISNGQTAYERFMATRVEVLKYYHWCILKDYLPRIVDEALIDDILVNGRRYFTWDKKPYIPLEFSVAAFRFGHSQVSNNYNFNSQEAGLPLFNRHAKHIIPEMEWKLFFFGNNCHPKANHSKKIGPFIAGNILNRTFSNTMPVMNDQMKAFTEGNASVPSIDEMNLAERNLMRGFLLHLPSGQAVAAHMNILPLEINTTVDIPKRFINNTPLWYYVLYEAYHLMNGEKLGPVGGRIVAEVLIGLLESDPNSILSTYKDWIPKDKAGNTKDNFNMIDLLRLACVYG